MSPTCAALKKIATGLAISVPQLFTPAASPQANGRMAVTRAGEGVAQATATNEHELPASALTRKQMLPCRARIRAHTTKDFSGWARHDGEEFLFVLTGVVPLFTEFCEPVTLKRGDSAYCNATMGHNLVSVSEEDATILWVTALPKPQTGPPPCTSSVCEHPVGMIARKCPGQGCPRKTKGRGRAGMPPPASFGKAASPEAETPGPTAKSVLSEPAAHPLRAAGYILPDAVHRVAARQRQQRCQKSDFHHCPFLKLARLQAELLTFHTTRHRVGTRPNRHRLAVLPGISTVSHAQAAKPWNTRSE